MTKPTTLRCAIYTRKSTDDGLDQAFNSLDAQREACSAYITSQASLGWKELPDLYDDGGVSGGTMDRPALTQLLADIEASKVDVIVVYKIDRLTRSLADFARMVEVFERHQVAFVSITQQFNTTSSMGRLTLNVLLSFAQFEREVTAERIRDKIAASRRKGLWMGGSVPFGYRLLDHALQPDEPAASTVRSIFERYIEVRSVRALVNELSASPPPGLRAPVSPGRLYHMLANPVYIGKVRHKQDIYEGVHDAILDQATFEHAQTVLADQAPRGSKAPPGQGLHLLNGLVFDETGDRLSPTHANRKGQRFRYYTSLRLAKKLKDKSDANAWRIPASELERTVELERARLLNDPQFLTATLPKAANRTVDPHQSRQLAERGVELATAYKEGSLAARKKIIRQAFRRIDIAQGMIRYTINVPGLWSALLDAGDQAFDADAKTLEPLVVERPFKLRRRHVEMKIVIAADANAAREPNQALVDLLVRAHQYLKDLTDGSDATITSVARKQGVAASEVSRIFPLAFLAPSIAQSILNGNQPAGMTAESLMRHPKLPLDWNEQTAILTM
ncbi:MAG: recombinase family protein [Hyphomicrobiales bacterium]